jgi:hypothetical protein
MLAEIFRKVELDQANEIGKPNYSGKLIDQIYNLQNLNK